jgi:quercetin dioxygenase-like cupin family protein
MTKLEALRRVVTGHDANGRAVFVSDDTPEAEHTEIVTDGTRFTVVWTTDVSPANNNDDTDGAMRKVGLTCPGGSVLRVVDFVPHQRSPMHRTHSIDYGIVLQGEIDLELDSGVVRHLRAGDIVVQRGTNHAWVCGANPARMAFVLLDAKPVMSTGGALPEAMLHDRRI